MHVGKFCTYQQVPLVKVHMNTRYKGNMPTIYATNINRFIKPRFINECSPSTAKKGGGEEGMILHPKPTVTLHITKHTN